MSRPTRSCCALRVITICALAIRAVAAQDAPPTGWARAHDVSGATSSTTVSWLGAWSPLRPIGDLSRGLLRAPLGPGLLDAPPPTIGAFLLAGASAALARDFTPRGPNDSARFGELRLRIAREAGSYRRPLDVADNAATQASGFGWAPAGGRGIAIGRFVIDRESIDTSSYTARPAAYGSSPFVYTDTVRPPMRRAHARLEGALGIRLGGFGIGIAAGIDAREHNSVNAPVRRNGRQTIPAVNVGVERVLPWAGVRVGGYYRWTQPVETNLLNPVPLPLVTVYSISGYEEPLGLPVEGGQLLLVRSDKRATAVGGSVEATVFGMRLVVTHEQSDRAEDQYRRIARVQPIDRWRATGHETRVAAQRMIGARLRTTIVGGIESMDGDAMRMDLTGLAVRGTDERQMIESDVRFVISPRWSTAFTAGVSRFSSARRDFVASVASSLDAATPFASIEIARRFRQSAIAVGASATSVRPTGTVPTAAERGPVYQRLIAPSLAYDAAAADAFAGWVTGEVPLRRTTLLVSARAERSSPASASPARLQPAGERTLWSFALGIRP